MNNKLNVSNILELIDKVKDAYSLACDPVIKEFNIPKVEFDIIMFLTNNPNYFTAKDISEIKKIKPNVVSMHVDKLVVNGYIKREPIENDRRKIKLLCTNKASEIIKKGHIIQKKFYEAITNGLSSEDMINFKNYFGIILNNANNVKKDLTKKEK